MRQGGGEKTYCTRVTFRLYAEEAYKRELILYYNLQTT